MHSHHSHSGEFCKHATSTLEEVVARASELGFTHFHLSEHTPRALPDQLYPEEIEAGFTPATLQDVFQAYLTKARAVQAQYATANSPMHILVGCETENISSPHSMDFLSKVLSPIQDGPELPPSSIGTGVVDYMVGSVHHVNGVPIDFDAPTFRRALTAGNKTGAPDYAALLHAYLDAQYETLKRLRPEVIGHFDLYRLFEPNGPWLTSSADVLRQKLERNIRFAASYGALFEANSAAFRKGWDGETYPGRDVLRMILSVHGRIALSDDSHGVKQIGLNYFKLRDYLQAENVNEIWYLERDTSTRPRDSKTLWSEFYAEEPRRVQREAFPSAEAPRIFARGTRAVPLRAWREAPFWTSGV